MQICNDNQFHHTPIKKLTHSFYELCESNFLIYLHLVIFHNYPYAYSHHSLPGFSSIHTFQSRSLTQTVCQNTYVRDFLSYYSFLIIIYLCKLFFKIFGELGGVEPTLLPSRLARCEEQFLRDLVCYRYTINSLLFGALLSQYFNSLYKSNLFQHCIYRIHNSIFQ